MVAENEEKVKGMRRIVELLNLSHTPHLILNNWKNRVEILSNMPFTAILNGTHFAFIEQDNSSYDNYFLFHKYLRQGNQ
jgi:hypothetical protein